MEIRIPRDDFCFDERIRSGIKKKYEEEQEAVKKKMATNSDKYRRNYEKLKRYFLDPIQGHDIVVCAIK